MCVCMSCTRSLWGVVGMILSVPITACIKICLQSLDHPIPRFLAGVFEGRIDNHVHEPEESTGVFHHQKVGLEFSVFKI